MSVTDSTSPHALRVVARYYDLLVEETFARAGAAVQIGNSDAIAVPVPKGSPYIARCTWTGPTTVTVLDGRGRMHTLTADDAVSLSLGAVEVELSLVPRYLLARTGDSRWWEAMPWLSVVLAASLLVGQTSVLQHNRCEWFFGIHPVADSWLECPVQQPGGNSIESSGQVAEYLERLLQEDYAGEDQGIVAEIDREDAEREGDDYYLPAGQNNDVPNMGGAEDVGDEIRTPETDDAAVAEAAPEAEEEEPLVVDDSEEVVDEVAPVEAEGEDGIADVEVAEVTDEAEPATPPEEDREGWGVQDWYDETDRRMEEREIQFMTQYAEQRLRIDPNDPDALAILSYYQYLDEDFEAALATYDKYITQLPESPAGYNNKALVYKRTGDYETEEKLYRVALAYDPGDVTALNNLAVCLAHQGRLTEAMAIMDELEALDPGDPYAELHRAKIYAEMGDTEAVYRHLRLALQGMDEFDTLHHIEFRQDIRVDPSFDSMRRDPTFRSILVQYYGKETPLQ